MEVGAEKLRYVIGYAIAVKAQDETAIVSLNDIFNSAKLLGTSIEPM